MTGTWGNVQTPFDLGLMLLLTDGSVLAQHAGTTQWWRLRPDRRGRYETGVWKQTAASANAPLYFASAVLADGRVFIAGGRYDNHNPEPVDLCAAEVYDPVAETWKRIATPQDWTKIGAAPCCVLPTGRVLLGNIDAGPCAVWDPATETWNATPAKLNGSSRGECWTLLRDGSVLAVDCIHDDGAPDSERFLGGAWLQAGAIDPPLAQPGSPGAGPAMLLPDGTVTVLGSGGVRRATSRAPVRRRPGPGPRSPYRAMGKAGPITPPARPPACCRTGGSFTPLAAARPPLPVRDPPHSSCSIHPARTPPGRRCCMSLGGIQPPSASCCCRMGRS